MQMHGKKGGPVVLPKMKGMGDGGQSKMTSLALNAQPAL